MKSVRLTSIILAVLTLVSCRGKAVSQYADSNYWYSSDQLSDVDVFYVASTNVADGLDENGTDTYLARLNDDDRYLLAKEFAFVRSMFGEKMNFYAPYYHQFTLSSMALAEDRFMPLRATASAEVCDAFDYYMANMNDGRRFILAGFSQGAMHILDILRHMSDEQYSRMVVAYSIGYRVSADDLAHPHIVAATSATDTGVTVSFNSVSSPDAIWPAITDGAATCINPVNWQTDATPASIQIDGIDATVHVDTTYHVLVVEGLTPEKYAIPSLKDFCEIGNYHLGDLLFYADSIGSNASDRAHL